MVKRRLVPPRIGTPRSVRRTLGGLVAEVSKELGTILVPWQRYSADVSGELEGGRLVAPVAGIVVPRQSGKSKLAEARAITQMLLPVLDGTEALVGHRVGPQHVGWLAQDRANALRSWNELLDTLEASPYGGMVAKIKRQRGEEMLKLDCGSSLTVITPSRTGPRGLSLDLVSLDEAMAHSIDLLSGLAPTQAQRDRLPTGIGSQFVMLSSAGDERSTLINHLGELGRRAVVEGERTRCWLEWSAEPDADPFDEAVWRRTMPTLDQPFGISTEYVRMQLENMELADFRREYLSLHTPRVFERAIDIERWAEAPVLVPESGLVFAIESTPGGGAASLVAVGWVGSTLSVEIIEHAPGVQWLAAAAIDKARRWDAPIVFDAGGPLSWIGPTLASAEVEVVRLSWTDVVSSAARFVMLVEEGRIGHLEDPRFNEAIELAVRRRSGDRWSFDRGAGDVSTLVAASLGCWALETVKSTQVRVW